MIQTISWGQSETKQIFIVIEDLLSTDFSSNSRQYICRRLDESEGVPEKVSEQDPLNRTNQECPGGSRATRGSSNVSVSDCFLYCEGIGNRLV